MKRWRGLVALIEDCFVVGTGALERVQKESAALPFAVLEAVPVLRTPARAVHATHDATLSMVYAALRVAGQAAGRVLDATLVACEARGRDTRGPVPQRRPEERTPDAGDERAFG